jgi:hypothetical protein
MRQSRVDVVASIPDLEQAIAWVDQADREPLDLVTDAVIISGRLGELGDDLVDHFVKQAREAGASWADIGQSMGVSKQAAQKRFVGQRRASFNLARSGLFTRFSGEARVTVQRAVAHANLLQSIEVNTLHIAMALAERESKRAFEAIAALSGSPNEIAEAAKDALEGPKREKKGTHIPFGKDAKKVLELSLRETIRSESRHIGSEHILLGILRDEKSPGARVLTEHGVSATAVRSWLDENRADGH